MNAVLAENGVKNAILNPITDPERNFTQFTIQ